MSDDINDGMKAWQDATNERLRTWHPAPAAPAPADQVKCGPVGEDEWKDQRIASLEAYVAQLKDQVGAPVPASVREAMEEGFMTACSGDGQYQIKIDFETFPKMQAAYSALIASLPAPAAAPTREDQIEAAAQALADDVWSPHIPLANLSEANKFRRQARIALSAILALKAAPAK